MKTINQNLKTQIQEFLNNKYGGTFRFLKEGMFRNNFGDTNLNEVISKTDFLKDTEYDAFSIRVRSYLLGLTAIPVCYCGSKVKFNSNFGWLTYCSTKCSAQSDLTTKRRVLTNVTKYGVSNVFSNERVREKIKKTCIERYGVDNYAKLNSKKEEPKKPVKLPDYLNETKLGIFLSDRLSSNFLHDRKIPESDSQKRYDYIFTDLKLIVEFDGYGHYTKSNIVINDESKDEEVSQYGYKLIRIPYFVQLTTEVIETLFGDIINDKSDFSNNYPHGFIDPKVIYPSSFCELGIRRFESFLDTYKDKQFVKDIINNLKNKVQEMGEGLVICSALRKYLD